MTKINPNCQACVYISVSQVIYLFASSMYAKKKKMLTQISNLKMFLVC